MTRPVRVVRHPSGPRLYVASLRVHHGLTGCVLTALGAARKQRALVVAGWVLMAHDAHDARVWVRVERCP